MSVIRTDRNTAGVEINRLIEESKKPRALTAAGGRAMANYLKKHFRELDRSNPNALGGKRQHFWLEIGRSVQNPEIQDRYAKVTVSDPRYAFKVNGGTIKAKRVRFLSIPVTAEAYGRSPSVFEKETGLKLRAIGHQGKGVLAVVDKEGKITVQYVLKSSVTQLPFPGAVPDLDKLSAECLRHVRSAAARQMNAK